MRIPAIMIILVLAGCSIRVPEVDASITAQSLEAEWPELVPLGPLLARAETPLNQISAEDAGRSLEWRAANLRYRAAQLRAISLN